MVVKQVRGRRRYIAFTTDRSLTKRTLEEKLSSSGYAGQIRVIQCVDGWCIVRCGPLTVERSIRIMSSVSPGSKSLSTSGNLISLRRKYPELWNTRSRYVAFTVDGDLKENDLKERLEELGNAQHLSVKFCMSGYAIVRCPLRDVSSLISMMGDAAPGSKPFLSSYKANELRRHIANREPKLRNVLLARK